MKFFGFCVGGPAHGMKRGADYTAWGFTGEIGLYLWYALTEEWIWVPGMHELSTFRRALK